MVRCFVLSSAFDGKQLLTASADRSLTRAFLGGHLLDAVRCPFSHDGASLSDEGAQQVPNSVTDHVSGPSLREGDGIHRDFNLAPTRRLRRSKRTNIDAFPTDAKEREEERHKALKEKGNKQYSGGDTSDIWYKSVSIAYDYISGAGECVFRQRDKYVLRSEAGCYKCLGLRQRSYNVLTMEETPTCHPSPDTAWAECEDEEIMASLVTRSMLYRAGNKIRPSQCSITRVFSVHCPGGGGRLLLCS